MRTLSFLEYCVSCSEWIMRGSEWTEKREGDVRKEEVSEEDSSSVLAAAEKRPLDFTSGLLATQRLCGVVGWKSLIGSTVIGRTLVTVSRSNAAIPGSSSTEGISPQREEEGKWQGVGGGGV